MGLDSKERMDSDWYVLRIQPLIRVVLVVIGLLCDYGSLDFYMVAQEVSLGY